MKLAIFSAIEFIYVVALTFASKAGQENLSGKT